MNILRNISLFFSDRLDARNAKNFAVQDKFFTRANLLTFSGICAVGLYVFQFTTNTLIAWIPITKIYVALTDIFDGWLADAHNEHSKIGKVLDTVRDRFDTGAVLINMWLLFGTDATSFISLIAGAEIIIFLEGLCLYISNKEIAEVHKAGKFRMTVHQVCAFAVLVQAYWLEFFYIDAPFLLGLMAGASGLALLSYNYFHRKELVLIFRRFAEEV